VPRNSSLGPNACGRSALSPGRRSADVPLGSEEIAGLGFEQVVRDAPVAIAVIDPSGGVINADDRARDLTSRQLDSEMPADLDGAIDTFQAL
jgi:PAS domain-containing protein